MFRDPTILILMLLFAAAGVIWQRYSARAAAERRRRLEDWARARGWHYSAGDDRLVRHWNGPPFVGRGWATDVFTGEVDGRSFTAFEYGYEEGSGDDSVTRRFQVTALALPVPLPMLWIAPERAFNRFTRRLGSQDIDFESAEFNRTFVVRADDERYAHAVIHPRMMEYLLRSPAREQSIRIEGNTLLMWEPGGVSTDRLLVNTSTLAHVAGFIPSHALEQHLVTQPPGERSFAGSITGVRPEPTPRGLLAPGFMLLWSLVWCAISVPLAFVIVAVTFRNGLPSSPGELATAAIAGLFALIGIVVLVIALARLIGGFVAIRLNKRDRDRRHLAGPGPDPSP